MDFSVWLGSNENATPYLRLTLLSSSSYPRPIPSALVKKGVFVFLGNRQPAKTIDYEKILDDFDRLLPLYRYVESRGVTAPVPLPKTGFNFKAGRSKKVTRAKAMLREQELDLDLPSSRGTWFRLENYGRTFRSSHLGQFPMLHRMHIARHRRDDLCIRDGLASTTRRDR
jgi:hypothetical protein